VVVRRRQSLLTEAARLEGIVLAARTLRHYLGNKLAVTVGYSEMLAEDPRLPEDLGEHATKIAANARAAVQMMDQLQGRIVRARLDPNVAGLPLLDIDGPLP
jgi:hypothetical protein